MPKKSIVRKCPQGSSFSDYDRTQFVSIDAEGPFNALVTKQSRIKERRFNINVENARMEDFKRVIHSRKWQLFCNHPNATAMTVVREFFANASEGTSNHLVFVKGKQVKYDAATINHLLCLQ